MSNIVINGLNISYKITGPGADKGSDISNGIRTAVILQGWGTSLDLYDSVAAAINDVYRVVQLDLPGFGDSDEPPEAWNVDAYADFLCVFMEKLGVRNAVLIGHSYGGRMIIKLAARAADHINAASGNATGDTAIADSDAENDPADKGLPFKIDKIVLVDSAGVMPERSWQQKLKVKRFRALRKILTSAPVHALFPEVIDYWISKQGSEDYRNASPVMKKCLVMAVNEDLKHLFPYVQQETLLVWGDADTDTPISDAHIMEELMPDAGLAVIEGAGHYSFLEQPVLFRTIIRTYLGADEMSSQMARMTPDANATEAGGSGDAKAAARGGAEK
ncbi:MAG: alpha/beta hydrolase [Mogibacterium sp.]|nr:alpha/beta hydrolase [Mogibacterium sp.]